MAKESNKDKYLLKALLYLLLYVGLGGEDTKIEKGLRNIFVNSHNPITDYGRSKTLMS